ncbi:unnamed protein product [Brassicogethes aeneus]|uniref:Ig-like domain-containing protein n=1 Tax=Brassicogethes aeneus TaxID=1431903 RepID=A0A9P0FCN5_BRAAE|nr:unnamed protein product [Brassicogethes aeneus]
MALSYVCILVLIGFIELTNSQQITKFSVPPQEAHEALLVCQYDLNGSKLYDVKWYKDDQNFFRCSDNGVQKYQVEGVKVSSWEPMASSCSLTLTRLTSQSAGMYRCEVTLETPSFTTLSKRGELRVTSAFKLVQPIESTTRHFESSTTPSSSTSSSSSFRRTNLVFVTVIYLILMFFYNL